MNNSVDDFIDYLENLRKNDLVPTCLLSSLSRLYLDRKFKLKAPLSRAPSEKYYA